MKRSGVPKGRTTEQCIPVQEGRRGIPHARESLQGFGPKSRNVTSPSVTTLGRGQEEIAAGNSLGGSVLSKGAPGFSKGPLRSINHGLDNRYFRGMDWRFEGSPRVSSMGRYWTSSYCTFSGYKGVAREPQKSRRSIRVQFILKIKNFCTSRFYTHTHTHTHTHHSHYTHLTLFLVLIPKANQLVHLVGSELDCLSHH